MVAWARDIPLFIGVRRCFLRCASTRAPLVERRLLYSSDNRSVRGVDALGSLISAMAAKSDEIDLALAEGAGGVGGIVPLPFLPLQPTLPPQSLRQSLRQTAPATAFPVFPQSFDMENSLRRGKFSHACRIRWIHSPLRTESKRRTACIETQ